MGSLFHFSWVNLAFPIAVLERPWLGLNQCSVSIGGDFTGF